MGSELYCVRYSRPANDSRCYVRSATGCAEIYFRYDLRPRFSATTPRTPTPTRNTVLGSGICE